MKDAKKKVTRKVNRAKAKIKVRVAKGKARVKAKVGKTVAVVVMLIGMIALAGCHMGEIPTAQRAQTSTIRDNCFNITTELGCIGGQSNAIPAEVWARIPDDSIADVLASMFRPAVNIEIGNLSQANETAGTESMTATPHNSPVVDTKPDIDVSVPVNKANAGTSGAAGGALETVLGAVADRAANALKPAASGSASTSQSSASQCADGSCTDCAPGVCEDCVYP